VTRRDLDYYPTPRWMVDHLLDRLTEGAPRGSWLRAGDRVLEPCVGAGNIVKGLVDRFPNLEVTTNDIARKWPATWHFDATQEGRIWERDRYDWIITNPPFSVAFDIVRQAVEVARFGVAMLLRMSWLEPVEERAAWLAKNPPNWELVMERYSFRRNGKTDSVTSCWFVWGDLPTRIEIIPGRGRQGELSL
jgi:hypothetical protein